jgi:hypothetical protein
MLDFHRPVTFSHWCASAARGSKQSATAIQVSKVLRYEGDGFEISFSITLSQTAADWRLYAPSSDHMH